MAAAHDLIASTKLRQALLRCRPHFLAAAAFSAVSNLLYLAPSIYMMQIYDRVLPSSGLMTLLALSVIGLGALATLSLLELLRSRLLARASAQLEADLAQETLCTILGHPELTRLQRMDAMRNFDAVRQGMSSAGMIALLDAPWTPIYIVVAGLLHPALGLLALLSSLLLIALAWSNERATGTKLHDAGHAASAAYQKQVHSASYASEVRALGMARMLAHRHFVERAEVNRLQLEATLTGASYSGLLKFLRLALQSGALALGAVLVVEGSLSAGSMIAASLLISRALAPIDYLVNGWKAIIQTRDGYAALQELFAVPAERDHTLLPPPQGRLSAERLDIAASGTDRLILNAISFEVEPGEVVGIVGQSGAGKSSLLRVLAGAADAAGGHIRFDGAAIEDWDHERLAHHVGYLPQSFMLFPGTVKENISRFRGTLRDDPAAIDAAVIEAASAVGAHEMILQLPHGYDTMIGGGGMGLSAGQGQRIALARALYGRPRYLILDEPTAHLDAESQQCFMRTLSQLRAAQTTILFSSHSSDTLASADKLLYLANGRIERFAPMADMIPRREPVSHSPAPSPSAGHAAPARKHA